MRKKSFAATITIIFCAIFVSVIGATFSTYLFRNNIIKIENPNIIVENGITILNEKDEKINVLKLSDMKLGIKPATGEEDVDTEIPSTVSGQIGSEGYFATFKITSNSSFKIYITNVVIELKGDTQSLNNERENIKVSLEDEENTTSNLVQDKSLLYSSSKSVKNKEYTLLVWLTPKASESLKGAKISFDLKFE